MKTLYWSLVGVGALLLAAVLPVAAQGDPTAVLQDFVAAVNRNDIPAQMAAFGADPIVIGGPCNSEPNNTCVGRAALQKALQEGPAQVTIVGTPEVSGNAVHFRIEERFPLPPQAQAAGAQRYVEVGTAIMDGDTIGSLALIADLGDEQTATLTRIFASLTPPPATSQPGQAEPAAHDGQTLAMQPAATQAQFRSVFGDQAAARWADEHNAELAQAGG